MVEVSGSLACLFSATVERRGDSYVLEVPTREVDLGDLESGSQYRIGLFATQDTNTGSGSSVTTPGGRDPGDPADDSGARDRSGTESAGASVPPSGPPVEEGETRIVTIESVGDEGDGIAKVERGYVIIVDDASIGETVRVRVHTVTKTVAFADVVERDPTPSE